MYYRVRYRETWNLATDNFNFQKSKIGKINQCLSGTEGDPKGNLQEGN